MKLIWTHISFHIGLLKKDINWLVLWEKVSRLGGANRKGFNRGFRQNDGDSVSVFLSFYVFVSFMLNFCIFLHNFTKRWRSCIGFSIVFCCHSLRLEIIKLWKNWYRISIVLMKKDINWLILWEKVSRLGGANRKGFNGGFRLHFDINFETDMDPYRFSYQFWIRYKNWQEFR